MKIISNLLLAIVTHTASIFLAVAEQKLVSVTPIIGNEQFYLRMKRAERPPLTHPKSITLKMKTEMCADILASPLFKELYNVEPVSSNNKVTYAVLNEKHPNIYSQLYKSENRPQSRDFLSSNPYKVRNVTVDGTVVKEDLFLCLARDRASKIIVEYFLSLSYNVVVDECYKYDEKRGFFIFRYNDLRKINVIALAEEPAYISQNAQNLFIIQHDRSVEVNTVYDENEIGHTICGLNTPQKIRVCSLVLTAKPFRQEVRFLPHEDNIKPTCTRRAVRFHYDRDDLTWSYNVDEDWMIGCQAVELQSGESRIYYVSAGFQVYEHFVCEAPGPKDTLLSGINCRIRVKTKK